VGGRNSLSPSFTSEINLWNIFASVRATLVCIYPSPLCTLIRVSSQASNYVCTRLSLSSPSDSSWPTANGNPSVKWARFRCLWQALAILADLSCGCGCSCECRCVCGCKDASMQNAHMQVRLCVRVGMATCGCVRAVKWHTWCPLPCLLTQARQCPSASSFSPQQPQPMQQTCQVPCPWQPQFPAHPFIISFDTWTASIVVVCSSLASATLATLKKVKRLSTIYVFK